MDIARHDAAYAALLAVVWCVYFTSGTLARTRLGLLLMTTGRFLLPAGILGFFGFVLWLVLSHP